EIRGVTEFADLFPDRAHHLGMGVPQRVHRDPAGQVEILVTGCIVDGSARTVRQRQLGCAVSAHQSSTPPLLPHCIRCDRQDSSSSGSTIVPTPAEVKTSTSNECASRPSIMCARDTPPLIARRQARIFGIMPLDSCGKSPANRSTPIWSINEARSGQFA